MMSSSTYALQEVFEESEQYDQSALCTLSSLSIHREPLYDVLNGQIWIENQNNSSQMVNEEVVISKRDEHEQALDFINHIEQNQSTQNTMTLMINTEVEVSRSGDTLPVLKKNSKRKLISKEEKTQIKIQENFNNNSESEKKKKCQMKNFPLILVSMMKDIQRRLKQGIRKGKSAEHSDLYVKFSSFFWEGLKSSRSVKAIKLYLICPDPAQQLSLLNKFNQHLSKEKSPVCPINNAVLKELQKLAIQQILKQEKQLLQNSLKRKFPAEKLSKFKDYVGSFLDNLKKNQIKSYNKSNDL